MTQPIHSSAQAPANLGFWLSSVAVGLAVLVQIFIGPSAAVGVLYAIPVAVSSRMGGWRTGLLSAFLAAFGLGMVGLTRSVGQGLTEALLGGALFATVAWMATPRSVAGPAVKDAPKHEIAMLVDVQGFEILEDLYGEGSQNVVRRILETALAKETRRTDLVGRFGEDSYVALLNGLSVFQAEELAGRVQDEFELRMEQAGYEYPIAVGITRMDGDETIYRRMVQELDTRPFQRDPSSIAA